MLMVYLDNCMFNRPFDDQASLRVRIETEAKLYVQQQIKQGQLRLIWSYILDFENAQNPFQERRQAIQKWRQLSSQDIEQTDQILNMAQHVTQTGIKAKDALHVACAIAGQADYFLSTDDKLLRRLATLNLLPAMNPVDFLQVLEA